MSDGAIFSIGDGSLVDLNGQSVPNFSRPSPVNLERTVDNSLQLHPVGAFHPAFDAETGSFLLEPVGINLLPWNMDLSQNVWHKGSNVSVRVDFSGRGNTAPDGTPTADRLRWDAGSGPSQVLRRTVLLAAATIYTLSAIQRLVGGLFGGEDVVRVLGDVVGEPKLGLASLNANPNRYGLLELGFTTSGRIPVYPGNLHEIPRLTITNVLGGAVTLQIAGTYTSAVNDWLGGQLLINGQYYLITGNTATANGEITVNTATTNLTTAGITSGMKAELKEAPAQVVTIEFYAESTVSVDWGGIQLEPQNFRTSMIYQQGTVSVRSASLLKYRKSPIASMKSFGIFAELKTQRGDGNVFDFGNLKLTIKDGKLSLLAGGTQLDLSDPLPRHNIKLFIQVLESNSSLVLYVNGILKAKTTLNAFRGDTYAAFDLTSSGLRDWQRLIVKDTPLIEGQVAVGDRAKADVAALFEEAVPIDAVAISAHAPLIVLPPVTIPPPQPPIARSPITALNGNIATVASVTGYVVGAPVAILRGDYLVLRTSITSISGNNLSLATAYNAQIGDAVVFGNIDVPGRASVRLLFDAIDPQIILAIDVAQKRLTVDSTLSFTLARAFVRTPLYQDVAEVLVTNIDETNDWLYVNDIAGLAVGHTIAQPANELLIDVDAYFAVVLTHVPLVSVAEKYINGIVLENLNPVPVTVTPAIRAHL